jgi:hypothetical protein
MKFVLLVVVGAFVLAAIVFALWLTRDELDTLPRDVDDDIDWLQEFKRWDRWE